MRSLPKFAPNTTVRVVVRGLGEVFGDVVDARVGDRIALAVWATGRSITVSADDVIEIAAVKLTQSRVVEIAARQASDLFRKGWSTPRGAVRKQTSQ